MKRIISTAMIVLVVSVISIYLSSCTLIEKISVIIDKEARTVEDIDHIEDDDNDWSDISENEDTGISQQILYLEIGISEDSMHFEHRVANIYSVNPDGSGKRLIYSDIDEKYDLGRVYNISPTGSTILCGFFEGGRGAYNSLSLIDIVTGEVIHLVEFDYTGDPDTEEFKHITDDPVWSKDGGKIAYIIANGQEITGDIYIVNSGGTGNRQLTYYGSGASGPLFSPDGKHIAFLLYEYNEDKTIIEDISIKSINIETGDISDSASGYLVDFIDWIEIDNLLK